MSTIKRLVHLSNALTEQERSASSRKRRKTDLDIRRKLEWERKNRRPGGPILQPGGVHEKDRPKVRNRRDRKKVKQRLKRWRGD